VCVGIHMPNSYNNRRSSNTLYMYDMDVGYSLKGLQPQQYCTDVVCLPTHMRISANSPSGEMFVGVTV